MNRYVTHALCASEPLCSTTLLTLTTLFTLTTFNNLTTFHLYFEAEKRAGYLFLAIGLAACWFGGSMCIGARPPFYVGLAIPMIGLGIVQIFVGSTIVRRTDRQVEDLEKLLSESAADFVQTEAPRMAAVMRNFVVLRWVEIGLIVAGLMLVLLVTEFNFWKGIGMGLLAEGILMLTADFFAEKRSQAYLKFIQNVA